MIQEMKVKEIMTRNVSTISPDSTIKEAAEIMRNLDVGVVPVCQGKKPVGIITDRDIVIRNVAKAEDANKPVREVMSPGIIYAEPDMSVTEAADIMAVRQVRRLPVVENDELVGIVSLGDLALNELTDMEAAQALTDISVPDKAKK
ncbi:MAG: CBS domain-containing protein [Halanaerobiales bacterium]